MKIAIASGKGGTGKTTLATNLAYFLTTRNSGEVALLDCDVEEPNSHLFLKPQWQEDEVIAVSVPRVNPEQCIGCGKCAEICQFGAIACLKGKVLVFPELCHSCGGCLLVCPTGALSESSREIGIVKRGIGKAGIKLVHGRLKVGEAMSPPLIKAVQKWSHTGNYTIIDCPPGTSCPVIQAIKGSDLVLLVTEPTPFGLNDLILAVEMIRELKLPYAVVLNRSTIGNNQVHKYCAAQDIPIIMELPHDRQVAMYCSRGSLFLEHLPQYDKKFSQLLEKLGEVKS